MPQIKIKSRHEPYRRCGVSHTRLEQVFPADRFNKKQLATLKADPHLVVREVADTDDVRTAAEKAAAEKAAAEKAAAEKAAAEKAGKPATGAKAK